MAWILAGLLVLLGLAWWGIPPLAKWQIETRGSEALGRAVTLERVGFVPWKLQTTLEGLQVAGPPDAQAPLLRVERVRFATALSSLWRLAPVVTDLRIEAPRLHLARLGEGRYDIDDLVARLSTPARPDRPPARFVLHNLQLSDGAIDFDDRALAGPAALHQVRDLQLALPAISSLAADRDGAVAPTLAFTLDGSRFDSRLEALPFAELRQGEAGLHLAGLDLARLRGYWPASLPWRPHAGTLEARLTVAFAQRQQPGDTLLDIRGSVAVQGLAVRTAGGREVLTAEAVELQIGKLSPLQRSLQLDRLTLLRPRLEAVRDAAGRLDLLPPPAPAGATAPSAPPWSVALARLELRQGHLGWQDAAAPRPVRFALDALELEVSDVAWPMARPAQVKGSVLLSGPAGGGAAAPARLAWSGAAAPDQGRLQVSGAGLPLDWAQPYLQAWLRPTLRGQLSAEATLAWGGAGLTAEAGQVIVDKPALVQGGTLLAGAGRLALADLRLDLAQRSLSLGRLALESPALVVSRDARGGFMFDDWLNTPTRPSTPAAVPAAAATPWKIALKALQVERGRIGWRDARPLRPVALDLTGLRLAAGDIAWPLPPGRGLAIELDSGVAAGQASPGSLKFRGSVQPAPLALDGRLDAQRLPLQALEPYFGDRLNVQLVRADLGFAGSLKLALPPAGMSLQAIGNLSVDNGRVDSATPDAPAAPAPAATPPAGRPAGLLTPGVRRSNSLFSWRTLQFRNATLRLAPGKPAFWGVHETTLGDFFARLAINEAGRLNLRDLTRPAAGGPPVATAAAPAAAPSAPPELHFGQTHFANGRVLFTDNFIKPAYSASLSELDGVLGAYDSVGAVYSEPAMATLALRGKAEGTAALDISGKLNPLANPLAIDIVAKVDDLDLPALSPYAVKYMGHGIQRGKLSVNVHYQIQPDGTLTAANSLVLRQLVFDEQADGSPTSLPVRLAAALLADSNGVIDLNLPISGSINDPKFSLGPVIAKALVNLVVRAVTSPFSLISSIFSGPGSAGEPSVVAFAPGSAELAAPERQTLDSVARALIARPALQLTVSGAANPALEAEAMRSERLRQLARYEKRRAQLAASPNVAAPPVAQIPLAPAEYPALLKRVYAATDMPKPRNLVGLAKDLPLDEMERLLGEQVDITPDAVRGLALQRGAAVRDYLASHGVPAARVFLGAVRTEAVDDPGWKPAAQLRLSAR